VKVIATIICTQSLFSRNSSWAKDLELDIDYLEAIFPVHGLRHMGAQPAQVSDSIVWMMWMFAAILPQFIELKNFSRYSVSKSVNYSLWEALQHVAYCQKLNWVSISCQKVWWWLSRQRVPMLNLVYINAVCIAVKFTVSSSWKLDKIHAFLSNFCQISIIWRVVKIYVN